MNNLTKNALGVSIIIGILVFAFAAMSFVKSYSRAQEPSSFRSFSVSGQGEVVAIPDIAQFTFSVITEGGVDISSLQTENVTKMNGAIDFVKANGVEDKDIKTQSFRLNPRYQYFDCSRKFGEVQPCPPPEIVGYTVTQTVLVKVRDFTKIGDILSGVITNGANTVSQLSFTIDNPDDFQDEARAQAIQKAQEKAEKIAKAGGFRVGKLLSIQEGYSSPYAPYAFAESLDRGFGGAVSAPSPTIEPGSQDVTINITLVYEIQ